MTLIRPDDRSGAAQIDLLGIETHFRDAITVFETAITKVAQGDDAGSPECQKDIRQLRQVLTLLRMEKSKIDTENRKQAGIVYDFAVDFKEARAEIRRRMARLRGAADPGEISG